MKQNICRNCDGTQTIILADIGEYIDCKCTDDRWNPNNQDVCLECSGKGCEWCNA